MDFRRRLCLVHEKFSEIVAKLSRGEFSSPIGMKSTYRLSRHVSARGIAIEARYELAYLGWSVSAVDKREDKLEPSVIIN